MAKRQGFISQQINQLSGKNNHIIGTMNQD
jgi:hypothetical protein